MKALAKRVGEVERRISPSGPKHWHQVIVDGVSEGEAQSAYEALHGPIAASDGIVFRVIVDPSNKAGDPHAAA